MSRRKIYIPSIQYEKSTTTVHSIYEYQASIETITNNYPGQIFFSIKEVTKILNTKYELVRVSCLNGKIPVKFFGRRKLIHLFEVARLLKDGLK